MGTARCALRIGGKGGKTIRGEPISRLDYFAAVDGQHEKGKADDTKRARARRLAKANMAVEDGESCGPPDAGHRLPHSLDVRTYNKRKIKILTSDSSRVDSNNKGVMS